MKMKLMIVLGLVIFSLCTCTLAQDKGTLRVMGVGTATVPVDTVLITVRAESAFENATVDITENADKLNRTADALISAGVDKAEIMPGRSQGISTYYTRICDRVNNTTVCRDGKVDLIIGQMHLRLKGSDPARVAQVVQAAESAGARAEVTGYALSDSAQALMQAREKAIENAKANAADYAGAFGLELGKAVQVEEIGYPNIELGSGSTWGHPFYNHHPMWMDLPWRMNRFFHWREIPPGMADVTAFVEVTYEVV